MSSMYEKFPDLPNVDDLDWAINHLPKTDLPPAISCALERRLREMRGRADDPGYFGADRQQLPAEILALPVVAPGDPADLLQAAIEHAPKVLPGAIASLVSKEMQNGLWWLNKTRDMRPLGGVPEIAFNAVYGDKARAVLAMPLPLASFGHTEAETSHSVQHELCAQQPKAPKGMFACSHETPCPVCLDISLDNYSEGDDCAGFFQPYDIRIHVALVIALKATDELRRQEDEIDDELQSAEPANFEEDNRDAGYIAGLTFARDQLRKRITEIEATR